MGLLSHNARSWAIFMTVGRLRRDLGIRTEMRSFSIPHARFHHPFRRRRCISSCRAGRSGRPVYRSPRWRASQARAGPACNSGWHTRPHSVEPARATGPHARSRSSTISAKTGDMKRGGGDAVRTGAASLTVTACEKMERGKAGCQRAGGSRKAGEGVAQLSATLSGRARSDCR